MGPPEAVDREFLYIDFLFCVCFGSRAFFFLPSAFFLLSSWLILPHLGSILPHLGSILGSSWLHLEPYWPHLEPSWPHVGPSWLHLEPSWLPKASPDHPKISFGAQRLPRANIACFEHPMINLRENPSIQSKPSRETFEKSVLCRAPHFFETLERILRSRANPRENPSRKMCLKPSRESFDPEQTTTKNMILLKTCLRISSTISLFSTFHCFLKV